MKWVQSPWFTALAGGALFTVVFFFVLVWTGAAWLPPPHEPRADSLKVLPRHLQIDFDDQPLENLIRYLSSWQEALEIRESAIEQSREALVREMKELDALRVKLDRYQGRIDRVFVTVDEVEVRQLKKLAGIYADMDAAMLVPILEALPEDKMLKLLLFLPDERVTAVFEAMLTRRGDEAEAAARVADLSRKLTRANPPPRR